MLPLLLLLVTGCLSASLGDDSTATPTINNANGNSNGYAITTLPETPSTMKEHLATDLPTLKYIDLNPASISPKDTNLDVDKEVLASTTTPSAMNPHDLATSSASIMTTPENQAITKIIQSVAPQGYEMFANSSMAPVVKPMQTLGSGVSANSNIVTDMKPMPTLGSGVSANSNIVTVPTLAISTGSIATTVHPKSSQGTSMSSGMTTQMSKGTTSGNTVTTTAAPKKNGGSSKSVSIMLSVVPVVICLVLNH